LRVSNEKNNVLMLLAAFLLRILDRLPLHVGDAIRPAGT
jgi:hypothetical protein